MLWAVGRKFVRPIALKWSEPTRIGSNSNPTKWPICDQRRIPTQFFVDQTRSLITHNDSPDIALQLWHQSLSWLRTWLRLLLCQAQP